MERTSEQIRMDEKQDILYRIKTGLLMMRRLSILIIVFTFVAVDLNAQDDNEYKMFACLKMAWLNRKPPAVNLRKPVGNLIAVLLPVCLGRSKHCGGS